MGGVGGYALEAFGGAGRGLGLAVGDFGDGLYGGGVLGETGGGGEGKQCHKGASRTHGWALGSDGVGETACVFNRFLFGQCDCFLAANAGIFGYER